MERGLFMGRKNRFLAILLALAMCVSLLPATALAEGEEPEPAGMDVEWISPEAGTEEPEAAPVASEPQEGDDSGTGDETDPQVNAFDFYAKVTYEGTDYEILFLEDWGDEGYGPGFSCGGEYTPWSETPFEYFVEFGVVTRTDENDVWCVRNPADEAIQELITELEFRFEGTNEDGAEGQNWSFVPDEEGRSVRFLADAKMGFEGWLTAEFKFAGEPYSVRTNVFYTRAETYLDFVYSETQEVVGELFPQMDVPVTGMLRLNRWNETTREYDTTVLTADNQYLRLTRDDVVSLSWEGEELTITPLQQTDVWFIYDEPLPDDQGNIYTEFYCWVGGGNGGEGEGYNRYVEVSYGDQSYEIEFLMPWGNENYGFADGFGEAYTPFSEEGFQRSAFFGAVTPRESDDDSDRTLAPQEIQDLITDLSFSYTGSNEDDSEGQNWIFTSDPQARTVSFQADCGKGFSGTLTADFKFDGEEKRVSIWVGYTRSEQFLTFVPDGTEEPQGALKLTPGEAVSGMLYLNQWNGGTRSYDTRLLTQQDAEHIVLQGTSSAVELSWDGDTVTILAHEDCWFAITYTLETSDNFIWADLQCQASYVDDSSRYAQVSYDGQDYEIWFQNIWDAENMNRADGCWENYSPLTKNEFRRSFTIRAMMQDPETSAEPILAPEQIQQMIHLVGYSFMDRTAGENGESNCRQTVEGDKITLQAEPRCGFSGVLTAEFRFGEEEQVQTIKIPASYERCYAYLSFTEQGTELEQNELSLTPNEPVSGTLRLYRMNEETSEYDASVLTAEDADRLIFWGVPLSLSWNGDVLTIVALEEGWFNISYQGDGFGADINGQASLLDQNTRWADVGDGYEVEFLAPGPEGFYPLFSMGSDYSPLSTEKFQMEIQFGAVTRNDPSEEWGPRTKAADEIQNKITNLEFSFSGTNDDGTEGENWSFTSDPAARKVSFGGEPGKPFHGILTASFQFDGVAYTVNASVDYRQTDVYLSFVVAGSEVHLGELRLRPYSDPLIGTLYLNRRIETGEYVSTALTEADQSYVNLIGSPFSLELQWTGDQLTLTPKEKGWNAIAYDFEDPQTETFIHEQLVCRTGDPTDFLEVKEAFPLTFEGESIDTGVGWFEVGTLQLGNSYGDNFTKGQNKQFEWTLVLGGLRFHGDQEKETYAPVEFFNRISDCWVEVEPVDGVTPSVSQPVKQSYEDLGGAELYTFQVYSEPDQVDMPFVIKLIVHFSYLEDDGSIRTYEAEARVHYIENTDVLVDMSDVDTADKLNDILASRANLEQYLNEKEIVFSWEGTLELQLPPVTYEKVIVCDVGQAGFYGVGLQGSAGDEGVTIMPGLEARSGLNIVDSIQFVANPEVTQSYQGESFTCGILCPGSSQAEYSASSIYGVQRCRFSGFDYAIRGTAEGYPGSIGECVLEDCDYGLYLDCPDFLAAGNCHVSWNTFIRCGDAICIVKLPATVTSYMYRIFDNRFIDCGRDLNIPCAGNFFCYGNYFGDGQQPTQRRTAQLVPGENTRIIANPCRRTYDWFEGDPYWIDPDLPTGILNNEASQLQIASNAFGEKKVEIEVLNLNEGALETVGVWTFGGEGA